MHLLKHQDALGLRGDFRIIQVDFWPEIKDAQAYIERQERRQVAQVDPEEVRRILVSVCPCWEMEHRLGVCPLGLSHRTREDEGHNTITNTLKKSVMDQLSGTGSPTNLLVTAIAAGTDASATVVTATQLGAEVYRDAPTYLSTVSSAQMQAFWYYSQGVANTGTKLQEWGVFGGGATLVAGSGLMLARFLNPFDKNLGTAASGSYALNAA